MRLDRAVRSALLAFSAVLLCAAGPSAAAETRNVFALGVRLAATQPAGGPPITGRVYASDGTFQDLVWKDTNHHTSSLSGLELEWLRDSDFYWGLGVTVDQLQVRYVLDSGTKIGTLDMIPMLLWGKIGAIPRKASWEAHLGLGMGVYLDKFQKEAFILREEQATGKVQPIKVSSPGGAVAFSAGGAWFPLTWLSLDLDGRYFIGGTSTSGWGRNVTTLSSQHLQFVLGLRVWAR